MKHIASKLAFVITFAVLAMAGIGFKETIITQGTEVTVKLVLGAGATMTGHTASDDPVIFHENVVTYTASSGTSLPTPTKPGTEFVSWVYVLSGELVRVSVMPATSGAVYFAYYVGDGTLANEGGGSSSQTGENVDLYLDTGGASLWNQAGALFYVYTFNQTTAGTWPGTVMSLVGGNIFTASIPGGFASVIFVRVSPTDGTVWNQTADLTYSSSYNLYTITGWSADGGTWSNLT